MAADLEFTKSRGSFAESHGSGNESPRRRKSFAQKQNAKEFKISIDQY